MSNTPTINAPPQGRTIAVVGDVYRFLATGDGTNGKYALFEALVGPGGGPPPHVHSREEEGFYVLEGEITFTVNGGRVVAAGTFANMPVGTPHSFKNEATARRGCCSRSPPLAWSRCASSAACRWPKVRRRPCRRRRKRSRSCSPLRRGKVSRSGCRDTKQT